MSISVSLEVAEKVYRPIVCINTFATKFIHHKTNVVVLYSLKFTFQIVIFHISDSKPLADFVFKLFYNYLGYIAFKKDNRYSFMTNSIRNNCDVIKQWKTFKERVHTVFSVSY